MIEATYKKGDRVRHPSRPEWGIGVVSKIEVVTRGSSTDLRVWVRFASIGENLRNGSGITPDLYRDLRKMGADAVTLGDHVFRDARITPILEDPTEPISRPANLSSKAPGKRQAGRGRKSANVQSFPSGS